MEARLYNHRVIIDEMNSDEQYIVEKECKIVFKRWNGQKIEIQKVIDHYDPREKSFPRGLLWHMSDKLEEKGYDINLQDLTTPVKGTVRYRIGDMPEIWDNQETLNEAIEEDEHGIGCISSPTGTGKSRMIQEVVFSKMVLTLITVPTEIIRDELADQFAKIIGKNNVTTKIPSGEEDMVAQYKQGRRKLSHYEESKLEEELKTPEGRYRFHKGFRKFNGGMKKLEEAKQTRFGKTEYKQFPAVCIVCHASIKKISQEYLDAVQMLISDEGHTTSESLRMFCDTAKNCYYRYFTSATLWRDRPEDMRNLMSLCSNRIIFEELPKVSIEKKRIANIEYFQKDAPKPLIPVDFFYRDFKGDTKKIKEKDIDSVFKKGIITNESRNTMIIEDVMCEYRDDRRILITVWEEAHALILSERISEKYPGTKVYNYFSQMSKKDKADVLALTKLDDGACIFIGTWAMAIGADTKAIERIFVGDGRKSTIQNIQRWGRGTRLNYSDKLLKIFDIRDWFNEILLDHSYDRKKLFEEYILGDESMTEKGFKKIGAKVKRG